MKWQRYILFPYLITLTWLQRLDMNSAIPNFSTIISNYKMLMKYGYEMCKTVIYERWKFQHSGRT